MQKSKKILLIIYGVGSGALLIFIMLGFYFKKSSDRSSVTGSPFPTATALPQDKTDTNPQLVSSKASDRRFEHTLNMTEFRYPTKTLPVEFLACDEDLASPFEDPYKFIEGLGFSREDFLPDQGDLQNLVVYLRIAQGGAAEVQSGGSHSTTNENQKAGLDLKDSTEPRGDDSSPSLNSDPVSETGAENSISRENDLEGGVSKSNADASLNFRFNIDPLRPFIKLELSQEISQMGKYRIRALTYTKENLAGAPEELELDPDSLVLQNKKDALGSFKKLILLLVSEGAQVGARSAIISQEYQLGGASGFLTLEFFDGGISRLTASGINCLSTATILSCRCTAPKEIP